MKQAILFAGIVVLVVAMTPALHAGSNSSPTMPFYEVRIGIAAHDVDNLWSRSRREAGWVVDLEVVLNRPAVSLFSGAIRPNLGLNAHTGGDTSKLYAGLLWEFEPLAPLFVRSGLGLALHNGEIDSGRNDKKDLGSRLLFRVPLEVGITLRGHHRLSIRFDHISNAYLADPNEGLDTVGFFYGYRF